MMVIEPTFQTHSSDTKSWCLIYIKTSLQVYTYLHQKTRKTVMPLFYLMQDVQLLFFKYKYVLAILKLVKASDGEHNNINYLWKK